MGGPAATGGASAWDWPGGTGARGATGRGGGPRPLVVRRPPAAGAWRIGEQLAILLRHSDLLAALVRHRIRVRYRHTVLGVAWAVLQPLSMMAIFWLVFTRIGRVSTGEVPYPLFAYTGLLFWWFLSASVNACTHALVGHGQLITKVFFPREILPISYVGAGLFDLAIASVVLGALLGYHGLSPGWSALYALPILALLAGLVIGLGLLLSALQVRFRDIGVAVPLLLYLWLFATPIVYPLSAVPPRFQGWFAVNPMTGIVVSLRRVLLEGTPPDAGALVVPLVTTALLLPAAYVVFKRIEATMADLV